MSVITIREQQQTEIGFEATVTFDYRTEYPITVCDPFTPKQEKELEWYFEQWFIYPMLEEVKAKQAAVSVQEYGEELFDRVFADRKAYREYDRLKEDLSQLRIEIISKTPEFQALHWEALKDPDLPRPLAVDSIMLRKILNPTAIPANVKESPVINLLVVTARPDEDSDVGYRTISRPLVELIDNSHLRVNIDLLRPGTYEALCKHLEEKGQGYYHIIHFDTHGALLSYEKFKQQIKYNRYLFQRGYGLEDLQPYEGMKAFLIFEGETKGKATPVEATELASLLTGKGIPICILNACQSGKQLKLDGEAIEAEYRETSLGSRLMAAGMQIVVAMGYSVTVSAAKIMMQQLYQHLFDEKEITTAIQLARKELFNIKQRQVYFNYQIDLEDWLLPVTYYNRPVDLNLREFTPEEEEKYWDSVGSHYLFPSSEYGFVGRDLEILKIEKALFRHNILLLQGMGGTGKTTLLNYLREWWQRTNFAVDIFYFGYDEKAWTLKQILFKIGNLVYADFELAKFEGMKPRAQVQKLASKLRTRSYVLMLDNLESITGQQLAIQNTLSEEEQNKIRNFLERLVGGKTKIILGSRSEEEWLENTFQDNIYQLKGLDPQSRSILAEKILKRNVKREKRINEIREDDNFKHLMKLLAGYPLAMEVVLANLKRQTPEDILSGLQAANIDLDTGSKDKTKSIIQCVEYSHSHLSPEAQKLLLCLAPFNGFFNYEYITNYSLELKKIESLKDSHFEQFDRAIQEAIKWGLLSPIDEKFPELLTIQPVFPYFLKSKLREEDSINEALEKGFKNHYKWLAKGYFQLMESKDTDERQWGIFFSRLEYENLYNALQICLQKQESIEIFNCLNTYLLAINDYQTCLTLSKLVCEQIESYSAEAKEQQLGTAIVLAFLHRANSYRRTGQYLQAKKSYLKTIKLIQTLDFIEEQEKQIYLARIYHDWGMLAQQLREYQQARQYYQQSLAIKIQCGERYSQAATYHQLGTVTQELREYQQAQEYYQQALDIDIECEERYSQAATYHQLGTVTQQLREYQQAQQYYQQALAIKIEYGDRYSQAKTYHHLGTVTQQLREYQQAQQYYQQALALFIEYNDRYSQAKTYQELGNVALQLGIIAQELREYQQAQQYYEKALAIYIEDGDRYSQAQSYHQLGMIAQELREYQKARQYYQQALDICIEDGDRYSQVQSYHQLAMIAQELREYQKARQYYQQALDICIEYRDLYFPAKIYAGLGLLAEKTGELEAAKTNLFKALQICIEFGDEHGLKFTLNNLAPIYKTTQDENIVTEIASILDLTIEDVKLYFRRN